MSFDFSRIAIKNFFSKPATCNYPAVDRKYPERYRGSVKINIDDCIMCGLCEKKCPAGAILVDRDKKTWTIERMACVQCENCVVNCPKKCLSMEQHYSEPSATKTVDTYIQPVKEEVASTGKPVANLEECVFCTLCAKNCPANALEVDRATKKWELNESICAACGLCANKCPKKCITLK